jgi:penicillin-binding protein 1A
MVLLTALREGVNPDTTHYTSISPMTFKDPPCAPWTVKTYGGKGAGDLTLRAATLKSDNSVYAQLTSDLGPDKIAQTAHDLGIVTKLNGYCAETLGGLERGVSPLEMANAYATVASGGYRNRPRAIRKIVFPDGHSELPARWKVKRTKAFDDGVTAEATKILEDNVQGGTGTHAQIGCPAAGKTGTTDHNTDAWFVGFTPRLSTAVWVGYPKQRIEMNGLYFGRNVDGGTFPADIWGAYMKKAVGKFCGPFAAPKTPFVSQPFFGHYATTGKPKKDDGTGDSKDKKNKDGKGDKTGTGEKPKAGDNGGTTYDPNQYETQPQGPPTTKSPSGQGNQGDGTPP